MIKVFFWAQMTFKGWMFEVKYNSNELLYTLDFEVESLQVGQTLIHCGWLQEMEFIHRILFVFKKTDQGYFLLFVISDTAVVIEV